MLWGVNWKISGGKSRTILKEKSMHVFIFSNFINFYETFANFALQKE